MFGFAGFNGQGAGAVPRRGGNRSVDCAGALRLSASPSYPSVARELSCAPLEEWRMSWRIGRFEATSNPDAARRKVMAKLRRLAELEDPESLVVPILIDAILMAESYRGARHQITFLPELTRNVDALIRELTIAEKAEEWAGP